LRRFDPAHSRHLEELTLQSAMSSQHGPVAIRPFMWTEERGRDDAAGKKPRRDRWRRLLSHDQRRLIEHFVIDPERVGNPKARLHYTTHNTARRRVPGMPY
jgi:hypothetical protein